MANFRCREADSYMMAGNKHIFRLHIPSGCIEAYLISPGNECWYLKIIDKSMMKMTRFLSLYSAVEVAEEMVKKYPSEREAKKKLAVCYKMKIFKSLHMQGKADFRELMRKCIHIYEEVTSLYSYYYRGKMILADIYSLSGNTKKADQIYMDLLKEEDLDPATLRLLYFKYGNHLWYKKSSYESIGENTT